jgi:hypothetical protein
MLLKFVKSIRVNYFAMYHPNPGHHHVKTQRVVSIQRTQALSTCGYIYKAEAGLVIFGS